MTSTTAGHHIEPIPVAILESCLAEATARQNWARTITDKWRANASIISLKMVEQSIRLDLDTQANEMARYWQFRATGSARRIRDYLAKSEWDAVLNESNQDGRHNFWQRRLDNQA
jgi:hypothetical protein